MAHLLLILILLFLSFGTYGQTRDTQRNFETATIAARNGDHVNAINGFRKALAQAQIDRESDEVLSRIYFNIGVCLFQLGHPAEAVIEFHAAIRLDPRYERAYYSLGMAELEVSNLTGAEDALQQALRLNNRNAEAWFDLAFVHIAKKDYDSAMSAFENAVKYRTIDAAISHNNIGVIAAMRGKIDEAERAFELALKASEGRLNEAAANLAACRAMRGERAQLVAQLQFAKGAAE